MKVMDNTRATLVIIQGPYTSLNAYNDLTYKTTSMSGRALRKKPYLIPFVQDVIEGNNSTSYNQRFRLHQCGNPLKDIPGHSCHVKEFDKYVETDPSCDGQIPTTCYNLSKYPDGLIFAFKANDNLTTCEIIKECVLSVPMQPNDIYQRFNAVVLSQWYQDPNFYHSSQQSIDLVHKVHGQTGFGDRPCASCVGTNVYHGERQTLATIGNPL